MTDESLNLLPCPFCGASAKVEVKSIHDQGEDGICCTNKECSANVYFIDRRDWNRRTPQPDKAGVGGPDYVPGRLDATAPARIWLQVDTSASNDERDEPFPADIDGVTWQDEQIGGLEVEYVRADLATPPPPGAGEDRRDAIDEALYRVQAWMLAEYDVCPSIQDLQAAASDTQWDDDLSNDPVNLVATETPATGATHD